MFILKIELTKGVIYNVNLGNSYIKIENIEECDPSNNLGTEFHDILTQIYDDSDDFVPDVVIFKNGEISWDNFIDINELYVNFPETVSCQIVNKDGIVEAFDIKNICEYAPITMED